MATAYKVLGQVIGSGTEATLYTVPSSTETIVSSIVICNINANAETFTIRVAVDNGTDNNKQLIAKDTPIAANDTIIMTLGLTIDASDTIQVASSDTNVVFNAFGSEIT